MAKMMVRMLLLGALMGGARCRAQVLLEEDFEGDDFRPLRLTHTNGGEIGAIVVHHLGISEAMSTSGKRSFKIDLTVNSGDDVHCTIPLALPFKPTRDLKVEGNLHARGATVSLGFYYTIPHARLADLVQRGREQHALPGGWRSHIAHEPRLHKSILPTSITTFAVYIRPTPGTEPSRFIDDRVVVYVDDITVTAIPVLGAAPAAHAPEPIDGYRIHPVKAITDEKVLPSTPAIPQGMRLDALALTAAGDEYESCSFAILSGADLLDVEITMPPFSKGDDTLNALPHALQHDHGVAMRGRGDRGHAVTDLPGTADGAPVAPGKVIELAVDGVAIDVQRVARGQETAPVTRVDRWHQVEREVQEAIRVRVPGAQGVVLADQGVHESLVLLPGVRALEHQPELGLVVALEAQQGRVVGDGLDPASLPLDSRAVVRKKGVVAPDTHDDLDPPCAGVIQKGARELDMLLQLIVRRRRAPGVDEHERVRALLGQPVEEPARPGKRRSAPRQTEAAILPFVPAEREEGLAGGRVEPRPVHGAGHGRAAVRRSKKRQDDDDDGTRLHHERLSVSW